MAHPQDELTFWEVQLALALYASAGIVWGTLTWLIQLWLGGPTWLPFVVGLVVFIILAIGMYLLRRFGHHS